MENKEIKLNQIKQILKQYNLSQGEGRHRTNTKNKKKELYYDFTLNGVHFKGNRPFKCRWDVLQKQIDVSGKRIIDFGSNIGLFGLYSLLQGNAKHVTFIEHDKACCQIINQLASVYNLSNRVKVVNISFNDVNFYQKIGSSTEYDCAFLLSSYKYFNNRQDLVQYLQSNQIEVFFEGDDQEYEKMFEEEFKPYYNIHPLLRINEASQSGTSKRNRLLYHFKSNHK